MSLTPGQTEHLDKMREDMSSKFTEPEYNNYRLIYTTDESKADVIISKNHTVLDYMAIGFVALAKADTSDDPVIVAMHEKQNKNNEESCKVFIGNNVHPLNPTSLLHVYEEINSIVQKHLSYENFAGFGIGLTLPLYFSCIYNGHFEFPEINMEFESFDDILYAQKLAFSNLKEFTISSYLGSLAEFMDGSTD